MRLLFIAEYRTRTEHVVGSQPKSDVLDHVDLAKNESKNQSCPEASPVNTDLCRCFIVERERLGKFPSVSFERQFRASVPSVSSERQFRASVPSVSSERQSVIRAVLD